MGALQLLRHSRVPGPLHGRSHVQGWLGLEQRETRFGLRPLRRIRVFIRIAGRLDRRPLSRCAERSRCGRCRHHHRKCLPRDGFGSLALCRPHFGGAGNGLPQAQHDDDGWIALFAQRPPPRPRVFDLLHGHQPRRDAFAFDLRSAGRMGQLAHWFSGRRYRHVFRIDPISGAAIKTRRGRETRRPHGANHRNT